MGKSQFKKKSAAVARRHNPIRVPDSHLGSGAAAAAKHADPAKEQAMYPILNKIKSADAAERTWACAAVTNLIANDPAARRLFQGKNIVRLLIERLTDSVEDVVVESSGALRNLAIDAGPDLCGEMYNKDVLTPLIALVPRIKATIARILAPLAPGVQLDEKELSARKFVFPLAENVLTLFWCLSETSNKTLQALNAHKIVPFLTAFLIHRAQIPRQVVLAAAQCLYSLSWDNFPCTKVLREDGKSAELFLQVLEEGGEDAGAGVDKKGKKAVRREGEMEGIEVDGEESSKVQQGTTIKVLIAGILRNMSSPKKPIVPDLDVKYVLPLLQPVLDVDLRSISDTVTATVFETSAADAVVRKTDKVLATDHVTPAEVKLASIERRLATVMTALEVLTGVCAGLADELTEDDAEETGQDDGAKAEEDQDMDVGGDDEDMREEEDDLPDEMEDLTDRKTVQNKPTSTPLYGLVKLGLHTKLARLGQATSLSYPPAPDADGRAAAPSIHPPTTSILSAIHLHAYEALNNLLLSISAFAPEPSPPLNQQFSSERILPPATWTTFLETHGEGLSELWSGSFEAARAAYSSPTVLGSNGQEIRIQVLEVIAGTWWSLARIFVLGGLSVEPQQIATIMEAFRIVTTPTARSRSINTLATLASRAEVTVEENAQIGDFLLSTLQAAVSLEAADAETIVAVVNGIIDVHADERSLYDSNFVGGDYLSKLTAVEQQVKRMSRAVDKRRDLELRQNAEEASENLSSFIAYRKSLL